MAAVNFHFAD